MLSKTTHVMLPVGASIDALSASIADNWSRWRARCSIGHLGCICRQNQSQINCCQETRVKISAKWHTHGAVQCRGEHCRSSMPQTIRFGMMATVQTVISPVDARARGPFRWVTRGSSGGDYALAKECRQIGHRRRQWPSLTQHSGR